MTAATGRCYHATARSDILPFVIVGMLGLGAVYAYRAFDQMDRDMEEYERRLGKYEAAMGMDRTGGRRGGGDGRRGGTVVDASFGGGTLAMDVGTTRTKLSHLPSSSGNDDDARPMPAVCVDREGHRSTPSIVWLPPPPPPEDGSSDEMPLFGRLAEARTYDDRGGIVLRPREYDRDDESATCAIRLAVRDAASNALDQALGGSGMGGGQAREATPLHRYSWGRPIAFPGEERYRRISAGLSSPEDIAVYVPEPVAIVAGAEHYGLLPSSAETCPVLVVDVGGTSTCVSIVSADDEVTYSAILPFGGETPIDLLVRRLAEDFFGPTSLGGNDEHDHDDDAMANTFTTRPKLDDPAALQRLHEASVTAIRELSNKTRTEINVPYLTMDMKTRQPRHLRSDISRNVVEAAMENWVGSVLVPRLLRQQARGDEGYVLSRALPPPVDLSTLFASAIARSLEVTEQTPHALRAVILVGGGARMPLVRRSMFGSVGYLAGDTYASKRLIMPEGEMGDELGVLGAAVWGSRRGI
ncbi:hypothetical protein ACHAXA_008506 [Cyclostephanos tholiformis]|uniref:Uncharacterized protein n=1 Tax=Cyclostephanos tholiformis TaxID=382380 RepID=A0ABD3RU82_9STRA